MRAKDGNARAIIAPGIVKIDIRDDNHEDFKREDGKVGQKEERLLDPSSPLASQLDAARAQVQDGQQRREEENGDTGGGRSIVRYSALGNKWSETDQEERNRELAKRSWEVNVHVFLEAELDGDGDHGRQQTAGVTVESYKR